MTEVSQITALPLIPAVRLFAQGRVASLGDRFRNGGESDWTALFTVLAVLAAVIAIAWAVARHLRLKESGGYHNHRSLFRELCRAHRLGWADRRLLSLVARRQGVVLPARLFFEPERFEPDRLEGLPKRKLERAAQLDKTLFVESRVES